MEVHECKAGITLDKVTSFAWVLDYFKWSVFNFGWFCIVWFLFPFKYSCCRKEWSCGERFELWIQKRVIDLLYAWRCVVSQGIGLLRITHCVIRWYDIRFNEFFVLYVVIYWRLWIILSGFEVCCCTVICTDLYNIKCIVLWFEVIFVFV